MWFWMSSLILGTLVLLALAYWLQRNSRRYEQTRLKDALSEEMQLTLRNERTENKLKKSHFEQRLQEASEARIQPHPEGDKPLS